MHAIRVSAPLPRDSDVSPEDVIEAQIKLWGLLAKHTALYTMGDSSSVPTHIAQELFDSICFVLHIDSADDPIVIRNLCDGNLDREFKKGLATIETKIELAKDLWKAVSIATPFIQNIALRDTLKSIGGCWEHYDFRFFAHEIDCDIDYPLCHAVPESLLGVDYINEYLRRLLAESSFLGRFDIPTCIRLLQGSCPDYRGLLINLYEPIATNALGLSLIGEDPLDLEISRHHRTRIGRILNPLSKREMTSALQSAARRLCLALSIDDGYDRDYLTRLSTNIQPRINVALSHDTLQGIFTTVADYV